MFIDDCQITHLISVRLKYFLCDFLGGVWGLLPVVFLKEKAQNTPKKSYSKCLWQTEIR